jgi:two-component system phosphate regulon sensor histidine kinase PhoR
MQALADDLILISKLEAGSQQPVFEAITINELLRSIVTEAEALSGGKHTISLDCAETIIVQAENNDIRSALGNIVFNAVRHNPKGAAIAIRVRQYEDFTDIAVSDDGLGLAIVKHSINRCGGRLIINSRLGHGAEFICRIPKDNAPS